MNYFYNITGVIKLIKPEGFGFILSDEAVGDTEKDIYFHASSLTDSDIEWSTLKVGQKVKVATVIVNRKGLQATEVTLIRPNSRAKSARKE
jgi:cold shock CspA family protein